MAASKKDGEKKINDFLTGFLEEMEEVPSAGPGTQRAKEEADAADSDDESSSGPDRKEVQRRMTNLKRQFNKTTKVIEKGRHSKEANTEFKKLGDIFQFLKFSPRMFDDIAAIARHGLNILREKEKIDSNPIS